MTEITDEMCRRAIAEWASEHIQGFSTPLDERRTKWGAPHYIRDVQLEPGKQEIWRGDSQDEMLDRCEIEKMRRAMQAALASREQAAEWVGYYFGLQRAINMKRLPDEFVRFLRGEMQRVEERLPPGTIEAWPRLPGNAFADT